MDCRGPVCAVSRGAPDQRLLHSLERSLCVLRRCLTTVSEDGPRPWRNEPEESPQLLESRSVTGTTQPDEWASQRSMRGAVGPAVRRSHRKHHDRLQCPFPVAMARPARPLPPVLPSADSASSQRSAVLEWDHHGDSEDREFVDVTTLLPSDRRTRRCRTSPHSRSSRMGRPLLMTTFLWQSACSCAERRPRHLRRSATDGRKARGARRHTLFQGQVRLVQECLGSLCAANLI